MSTQYHIDSTWRNKVEFPNPAEFSIPISITNDWRTKNRTVSAVRPHDKMQVTNLVHTANLLNLTLPYSGVISHVGSAATSDLISSPFVYVSFKSTTMYKDNKLINTLEGDKNTYNHITLKNATFVAYCDKVQMDASGNPKFIQYKSPMTQTFRIDLKDSMSFRVFDNTGTTISLTDTPGTDAVDPSVQVSALIEMTPYARDGDYDNHFVTLYNRDA